MSEQDNYKIVEVGWYLISGLKDHTINDIVNTQPSAMYQIYAYLEIDQVYFPTFKDADFNDASLNDIGIPIVEPSALSFNGQLGVVESAINFVPSNDLGAIVDFNTALSENTGLWIHVSAKDITPYLTLTITNVLVDSVVTDNVYQGGGGNGTEYPPIYSYQIDDGAVNICYDANPISLDSSGAATIDLVIQRSFSFNTSMITPAISDNEPNLVWYDSSLNNNRITSTGLDGDYDHNLVVGTDFSTDSLDASAQIVYTIVNSGNKTSFDVTVNLSVIDTVPPLMIFSTSVNTDNENSVSAVDLYDYASTTNSTSATNFRGTNNDPVTITLNQSYIQANPTANLLPKVVWYDQNNSTSSVDVTNISYNDMPIVVNPDSVNASSTSMVYSAGEWRPGTYSLTYSCTDDANNTTTVNVNFIINDNIFPTLTITAASNDIPAYTTQTLNVDYNDTSFVEVDETGVGVNLTNPFVSKENSAGGTSTQNLFIYYSDVSANANTWSSPTITEYSDYSGIILDYDNYTDITNTNINVTYR